MRRLVLRATVPRLRAWDYASAARVDQFIANSENVRRRIWKTYRREADVVYPPVTVEILRYAASEDYYLIVSELVPYKRSTSDRSLLAQEWTDACAWSETDPSIGVSGAKPGGNIEFCGRVTDQELRSIYSRCLARRAAREKRTSG